jgi:hypothetical protein
LPQGFNLNLALEQFGGIFMQLDLFSELNYHTLTEELFQAYFDCRKNKRNTHNALHFEKHFEQNVFQLIDEIFNNTYFVGRSIAFIVDKPVTREVFAADFRDRVVHHWLINKLNPLFEALFIQGSYACRVGKGTHYGIQRVNTFIKDCSDNYSKDCYILKLDIQGFFMHINRNLLFDELACFIHANYTNSDKELVLRITRQIVFNDPTKNCLIKGYRYQWNDLPKNKSLFHSPTGCGLPIGNLTSQVFANYYMHKFDAFVTKELGLKFFGRYVDDFIIVHSNKDYLKALIPKLSDFLLSNLQLTLHPKKIYLQHYSKGVKFLGAVIKPNRIYIANRTKGNFYLAIHKQSRIIEQSKPTNELVNRFLSSMNSYLGIMIHYKSFYLRKSIISKNLSKEWLKYVYLNEGVSKFSKCKIMNKSKSHDKKSNYKRKKDI